MPLISIITTTYNQSKYIANTIESVLNQSYQNWELLIGDDNSSDDTYEIAKKYETDSRIKVWKNNRNLGIVDNMNSLLSNISSDSEYISFLEGDDIYSPDNLEEKLKIFNEFPEVALVYSDLKFIDKDGRTIVESYFDFRNVKIYKNVSIPKNEFILSKGLPIASWSAAMINRKIIKDFSVNSLNKDNLKYSVSDYDTFFKISTKYKVYSIEKQLLYYRRHQTNLSGPSGGNLNDFKNLIEYYYENNLIDKDIYNKKLCWIYIINSIYFIELTDKNNAIKKIINSFKYSFFGYFQFKIFVLLLLIMPYFVDKCILNKIIKRS